jgi:hypothetical protein
VHTTPHQVAAQEGKYLARRFNNFEVPAGMQDGGAVVSWLRKTYNTLAFPQGVQGFQYRHLGSLAYIGTSSSTQSWCRFY